DLPGYAELRERAERRVLVRTVVPNRLVEPDQALLDEVVRVAAGEEVGARLQPHEPLVAADDRVHRPLVALSRSGDQGHLPRVTPHPRMHLPRQRCVWPRHHAPPTGKRVRSLETGRMTTS